MSPFCSYLSRVAVRPLPGRTSTVPERRNRGGGGGGTEEALLEDVDAVAPLLLLFASTTPTPPMPPFPPCLDAAAAASSRTSASVASEHGTRREEILLSALGPESLLLLPPLPQLLPRERICSRAIFFSFFFSCERRNCDEGAKALYFFTEKAPLISHSTQKIHKSFSFSLEEEKKSRFFSEKNKNTMSATLLLAAAAHPWLATFLLGVVSVSVSCFIRR